METARTKPHARKQAAPTGKPARPTPPCSVPGCKDPDGGARYPSGLPVRLGLARFGRGGVACLACHELIRGRHRRGRDLDGPSARRPESPPCGVPGCKDPEGGWRRPNGRPERNRLTRFGRPEVEACRRCFHRVRDRHLKGFPLFGPVPKGPQGPRAGTPAPRKSRARPRPEPAPAPPPVPRCEAADCPDPAGGPGDHGGPERFAFKEGDAPAITVCLRCRTRLLKAAVRPRSKDGGSVLWPGYVVRPEARREPDTAALVRLYAAAWGRVNGRPAAPESAEPKRPKAAAGSPLRPCVAPGCDAPEGGSRERSGRPIREWVDAPGLTGWACKRCAARVAYRLSRGHDLFGPSRRGVGKSPFGPAPVGAGPGGGI